MSSYRNRHGFNSQNVLAACNFDSKFIYVLSGWEGSSHDSKLLNDALSRRNGLEVPQGNNFFLFYLFFYSYLSSCSFKCRNKNNLLKNTFIFRKIFSCRLWIF